MRDLRRRRLAVLVLACVLTGTACGARLSTEERAAAIGAGGTEIAGQSELSATQVGTSSSLAGAGNAGPLAAAERSVGRLSTSSSFDNGGATDLGVTRDEITIATLADVSGPVPGLAKSAHQAMAALTAFVNHEGGIYGRSLRPLLMDSRMAPTQTAAGVADACDRAFALVGSASVFDDAGAEPGAACGIPDLTALTVSARRASSPNVYSAAPVRPDHVPMGLPTYFREHHPNEIRNAAMLWLNLPVTRTFAAGQMKAYTSAGFRFVYEQEVQILEGNYSPFVYALRDAGVDWVTFWADDASMARMLQAMDQAGWRPRFVVLPPSGYLPRFLHRAGPAANGTMVFSNTMPLEESASIPEMQLYLTWLRRVAPGAEPDFYGLMAWSAGRLFVQTATAAGPHLTRAGLFAQLRKIRSWDGFGMHAPNDVGGKRIAVCFVLLGVERQRFVRVSPSQGMSCLRNGLMLV